MNIARLLQRSARRRPDHVALQHGSTQLTHEALTSRVARLAGALRRRGLEPGDRVVLLQDNHPALVESLLACFHAGLIAVPLNARSTPHEVEQLAADCQPAAWIHDERFAGHVSSAGASAQVCFGTSRGFCEHTIDDLIDAGPTLAMEGVGAHHPAWLFYTSGTTGRMKGAVLTHDNLLQMTLSYLADIAGDTSTPRRVLHVAPLTHGSGLYLLPHLAVGATQLIADSASYDPDYVMQHLVRGDLTDIAFLAPTMLNRLVHAAERSPSPPIGLSNIVYGGAPMYASDLRRALDTFGPVLTQIYGQAEAPMTITRATRRDHQMARETSQTLQSAGRAFTSVEVAVDIDGAPRDEGTGEILVRGGVVMHGYWNEPGDRPATVDGWLHTGDVGCLAPDGTLSLLDRNKDVIITGGSNVYPREVEEVILQHPLVREATVVGAPDSEWGERVVAVLVADADKAHDRETVEADVVRLCRQKLSGYKLPRQIDWVEKLPTNPYGKILKREVRATYWKGQDRLL